MARMYPEEFRPDPHSPSDAEELLYREFARQLDERYVVFHRCGWLGEARDGEIDFVIARPDLGVLCVEAKGGGLARDARTGTWHKVGLDGRRGEEIGDPVRQAVRGKNALLDRLKAMPGAPRDKWWALGHAFAFPHIEFPHETADLRPEIVLDRAALPRLDAWVERAMAFWKREGPPPGREGVDLLTRLLGLSFSLAPAIGPDLNTAENELVRLTRAQFRVLDGLSRFRRVLICGCAGSGKTMLALEKARRLSESGARVLFLCYNKSLRDSCREFLKGYGGVTVDNFHGLCVDWAERAGLDVAFEDTREFWKVRLPNLFLDALAGVADRFDAILVDEGQDFDPAWWGAVEATLRDPRRGLMYIFYDDNQLLYNGRLEFPPVESQFDLTENCRNSRKIHDLVRRYYRADRELRSEGPPGWAPEISVYRTEAELLDQVEAAVLRFVRAQKIPFHKIAVLTGHGRERSAVWRARKFGGFALTEARIPKEGELRWSSIHAFKGLEAPAVILAEIEPLAHAELETLLYVGCSRARLHLAVIASEAAASSGGLRPAERG